MIRRTLHAIWQWFRKPPPLMSPQDRRDSVDASDWNW